MKKVSIIIPVYNVEKYIKRCIDSILNQTYNNFELILINDGSKDDSLKIIKDFEKKDKRIRVYTQQNRGPALTRNRGIKLANFEYIMFIDSDDYIDNDFLESYYSIIKENDYDIVMGGYKKITGTHIDFIRKLEEGEFSKYIVTGPVCKLYKRDFLLKNEVYFLDTTASEDVYFNLLAYSKNPKIKIIDNTGYYYYFNPSSLSNTVHKGFNQDVDILGLTSKINYNEIENIELNQYFIIRYLIWYLLYSGKTAKSKDFIYEYNKLFYWLRKNIKNYRKNNYIKKCPRGEIKKIYIFIKVFILLDRLNMIKLFSKIYCRG